MGFQWRKRSKGKNGWINGSYSKKGAGVSGSVKVGKNVTYNTGDLSNNKKTPSRLTVNLGGGLRWVGYGKTKKDSESNPSTGGDGWVYLVILVLGGLLAGLVDAVGGVLGTMLFVFIIVCAIIYFVNKDKQE